MQVTKRNGTKEVLEIDKIKKVIHWGCQGLKADPMVLEGSVKTSFYEGIETRDIHSSLIDTALKLCSASQPAWRLVAGRLLVMNIWKEVSLQRRNKNLETYLDVVRYQQSKGRYSDLITQCYTEEQLIEAGTWVNSDWDLEFDYAGVNMLQKRYLLAEELPQECFLTTALLLASQESEQNRLIYASLFYSAIAQRKISLATTILMNLRRPKANVSSCFIASVDDSWESIAKTVADIGNISKNAGGVGVNISRIRAKGSWVAGTPNASNGVAPWIKLFNDTAVAVNQQGKRAGAVTVALDLWHLDIPEFLELQTEVGDKRFKCYDIFPQIVVPDEFMKRVERNLDWTLFDPYEVRTKFGIELAELWGNEFESCYLKLEEAKKNGQLSLVKTLKAKELLKTILRVQVETGLPYFVFKDTINKFNPNKYWGSIPSVNLCIESYSTVVPHKFIHCCNLVSINQAIVEDDELEQVTRLCVRLLDNAIDLTTAPVPEAEAHNQMFRTIGVGQLGLADWLAKRDLFYTKAVNEINKLQEDIAYYAFSENVQLAKERGTFLAYSQSEFVQGKILCHDKEWFKENSYNPDRWLKLIDEGMEYGHRCSQLLAIAPNTSTSLLQGSSASVLPVYNKFFYDKAGNGAVPIAPPYLDEKFWYYPEFKNLDTKEVIKIISIIQKWTDTGISMELVYDFNKPSVDAKYMYECILESWRLGIKAIYYIRTVTKSTNENPQEFCTSCSN